MDEQVRASACNTILQVIQQLQAAPNAWVDLARIGAPLTAAGVSYKQLGYQKLRPFLNEFRDVLAFKEEQTEGKPPVCYVRPKCREGEKEPAAASPALPVRNSAARGAQRVPTESTWLFDWALILQSKIKRLSELALEEKWYYGEATAQEQDELPILRNYLAYTFKRLCREEKIAFGEDSDPNGGEYAAFNTGLVDKKYEYIYALFKRDRKHPTFYWYLLDFVVQGEDIGKTLVKVFNPLPKKADYFHNRIENMLYDTSTGDLSCDYTHIITERTDRLPAEFLKENCGADFVIIDGISLDDVCHRSPRDQARKEYFLSLGQKINSDSKILNRLINRIKDAVSLALKKVEWNYKTAIPVYFPAQNTVSLLLPLCLVDEDHVDLALVVERQKSGAYQGQTILPLNLAYTNSRLITRPDSDWLKTDVISNTDSDETDDD